ncbi:unnamed protein product [Allacma fusca]|uniref:Corticotropin-releasing factor domain-containing protein n=1 Tax=Allacma fusca TaxID=39272 RepID=A0A8J2PA48_9HEXA|nr:unnamed protein product [Allacma fusca]
MESHSDSNRKRTHGVDPAVNFTSTSSTWTLTLFTILLFLISSAQCLPVDLETPESSKLSLTTQGDMRQQPEQQLVHQGQLYLPSLFQKGREALSSQGSDYPRVSQSQDDLISTEWDTVIDPHLYVLNEWSPSRSRIQQRKRRNAGPSLSIVNPLDVLRQRLLLEIARRRMIKSQNQILANAEILKNIGRRR